MKKENDYMLGSLIIIMMVSMCASIFSCVWNINKISKETSESDSRTVAAMVSNSIENSFLRPIMVAETMSQDYSLKELMKDSGEASAESVEGPMSSYLASIRDGFGYQMVFAVCDKNGAYYTYDGISKFIDPVRDNHDVWYSDFRKTGKHYDLDVDLDEVNNWERAVFVNTEVRDANGTFLGVCGIGVEMRDLQEQLRQYEEEYNIKIDLIDPSGLIQVDSEGHRIENEYLDGDTLSKLGDRDYLFERVNKCGRVTKYLGDLGWYLVVQDNSPSRIDVYRIVIPSIAIFIFGLLAMMVTLRLQSLRHKSITNELSKQTEMSLTEGFTGLYNRKAYEDDFTKLQDSGEWRGLTILVMDLNGLKTTNDTLGHDAGDELVLGAAEAMKAELGKYGKIYRTGGDEFIALLERDKEQMKEVIHRLDVRCATWHGKKVKELAIAKGYVVCDEIWDMSLKEMERLADKYMYDDKNKYYERTGKNRRKQ